MTPKRITSEPDEIEQVAELFSEFGVLLFSTLRTDRNGGSITSAEEVGEAWREFGRKLARWAR